MSRSYLLLCAARGSRGFSYKLDGISRDFVVPFNASSTTDQLKAYIKAAHMVTVPFALRFYVKGEGKSLLMSLKLGMTLEECGVVSDTTCFSVHYCTLAVKRREMRRAVKVANKKKRK